MLSLGWSASQKLKCDSKMTISISPEDHLKTTTAAEPNGITTGVLWSSLLSESPPLEITTIDELVELMGMNWDSKHWHEQFMSRIEKLKSTGVIRHGEIVTSWWTVWPKAEHRKTERLLTLVGCELNTGERWNICYGAEGIKWFK